MFASSIKRDIVFFLGAGFSKDAGLPLMSDFGSNSEEDFKGLSVHASAPQSSPKFRNAAPILVEAAKYFKEFRNACKQTGILSSKDPNMENLEIVFCVAEALREAGLTQIEIAGQHYSVVELIHKIQLWLWKVFQQCPILNTKRKTNKKVYDRFFAILKKLGIDKRLTVITTNYDLIYEYMSWIHGMPCVYHWEDNKNFIAGYGTMQYIYQNEEDHPDKTVICKLHGSVNYFFDPNNPNQDFLLVAKDLGDKKPIWKSGSWEGKPAIFAVEAIWNIWNQYNKDLTPAIIPPTYAKLTGKPWLRKIWNRAFHALSNAQKLIFIGYRLPESDGFIRALIHGAMIVRSSIKPLQVFVIDKSLDVHNSYKELFGPLYNVIDPQTLEEATKGKIEEILKK